MTVARVFVILRNLQNAPRSFEIDLNLTLIPTLALTLTLT